MSGGEDEGNPAYLLGTGPGEPEATWAVTDAICIKDLPFSSSTSNVGAWGTFSSSDPVICTLSLGWPEQSLDSRAHFVTADFSESRTRASNLTIPFDSDHMWFDEGKFDWKSQDRNADRVTDIIDTSNKVGTSRVRIEYTQDPLHDATWAGTRSILDNRTTTDDKDTEDGDGRFIDDFRLLRLQVRDNRATKDKTGSGGELSNDKLSYSYLSGWRRFHQDTTSAPDNSAVIIPSEVERSDGIWFTSNKGGAWSDLSGTVDTPNETIFTLATEDTFALQGTQTATDINHLGDPGGIDNVTPNNYLLMAREEKFDGLYFGIKNIEENGLKMLNTDTPDNGLVAITVSYPAKDWKKTGGTSYIRWKPLAFVDYTKTPKRNTSLYISGPVMWDIPDDWEKCQADTTGFTWPSDITAIEGDTESMTEWHWDAYAVLVSIHYKAATNGTAPLVKYVSTYDNEHSALLRVQDSHHVSLNDLVIAQSVSWKRQGRYQTITDRIGKAELRKIGSSGGTIRLGGISFGDYETDDVTDVSARGFASHKKVKKYQKEGTPVYIDMQYPNGSKVRFFGKVMSLAEDIPTGRVPQKWAIDMGIEAIAEFKVDGTWLSDGLISIGGELDDRSEYI